MGTSGSGKSTRPVAAAWPAERGTDPDGALPSFWPNRLTEAVLAEARGAPGPEGAAEAPWERWFERAREHGVDEELAGLGRALMEEASVSGWAGDAAAEGGLLDDGEAMLELAQLDPESAAEHWQALLDRS